MKDKSTKKLFVDLTPQQAASVNGGRRGADDGPLHDVNDDRGGRRGRGADDGIGHR